MTQSPTQNDARASARSTAAVGSPSASCLACRGGAGSGRGGDRLVASAPRREPARPGRAGDDRRAQGFQRRRDRRLARAEGVVANSLMFRLKARDSDLSGQFKPGTYTLATGMPYELVIEKLAAGPDVVYYDVTIPEGYTAVKVAERVSEKTGISREELTRLMTNGRRAVRARAPVPGRCRGRLA